MFWVMVGAGVFLFVPLGFELLFRTRLLGGYQSSLQVLLQVLIAFYSLRWAAYGLLVLGPLALKFSRADDPSLTGATLPDRFDHESDADAGTEDSGEGRTWVAAGGASGYSTQDSDAGQPHSARRFDNPARDF